MLILYDWPQWSLINTSIIENTLKDVPAHICLSFCAVFSLQMSTAIEISVILATPNVTKTNDIWKKWCFPNILEGSITPQSNQNTF